MDVQGQMKNVEKEREKGLKVKGLNGMLIPGIKRK